MKRTMLSGLMSALLLALVALPARAADPVTDAIAKGTTEFVQGAIQQFGQSPQVAAALKAAGIKEEELPLLLTVAQQSKKTPEEIAKMRQSGRSWNDIMTTTKVSPETIYAPATGPVGPPYGNAYGYFRNRPQKDWKNIKLTDEEAVGLANVKYLSQRHQVPPAEIIRRKAPGKSFAAVDDDVKKDKQAKTKTQGSGQVRAKSGGPGNSPATGNSRGKGQGGGNGKGKNQGGGQGNGRGPKK